MGSDLRPTYAADFVCIGPACEDMCCRGWPIPVDRATYAEYQLFPLEKLGAEVATYVSVPDPTAADAVFAQIIPKADEVCPFFAADRLCNIQREYGAELLSATCSSYPRSLNQVEGRLEGSLMLSCPEAAREVLLRPGSTRVAGAMEAGGFRTDNFFTLAANAPGVRFKPYRYAGLVRAWLAEMLEDRARPLWQRVLLIGSFCRKLDDVTTPEGEALVPAIVADYRQILGTTWGAAEMEAAPSQPRLQLKVLMRLTAEIPQDANCGARFRQTYLEFIEGIAGVDDVGRFRAAGHLYWRPYAERMPWVMENYLLNYLYQQLFPFGRGGSVRHAPRPIWDEFLLMAVQFFWVSGLLAGVAGCHGDRFSDEHVVHTVQSFCREVEHRPGLPGAVLAFLRQSGLDSMAGMAALLRA